MVVVYWGWSSDHGDSVLGFGVKIVLMSLEFGEEIIVVM